MVHFTVVRDTFRPVWERSKTILERSKTILECSKTILECSKTILECSKTILERSKTILECSKTILECSKTILECSKTILECSKTEEDCIMAAKEDYIPSNDAEFDVWFNNLVEEVFAKVMVANPEWTHIPKSEAELLAASYTAWHTAYQPTLKPHTPAQTLAKDEAREEAKAVIRPFVGQWLMWKQVTDQQRREMGLHVAAPRRDHIPAPATVPELSPRAGNPRQVVVPYRDKGAERRGKPKDVHGIEVRWAILDHPPADVKDLVNSSFDTKSPLTLDFEEHDRGKRVYMVGLWEIEREGIKGKPGEIVSVIIP
jgi:hypothetical protein